MRNCPTCRKYYNIKTVGTNKRTRSYYCVKHYRFQLMKEHSRQSNKYEPTFYELEAILENNKDLKCRGCGCKMNWLKKDGFTKMITLQHNVNNTLEFLCVICNLKYNSYLNENFYKRDKTKKLCSRCKVEKNVNEYYKNKLHWDGLLNVCKPCSDFYTINSKNKLKLKNAA